MIIKERHSRILGLLKEKGFAEVSELAVQMDVSVETIRRDLNALEAGGFLRRTYGGAEALGQSLAKEDAMEPRVQESNVFMAVAPYKEADMLKATGTKQAFGAAQADGATQAVGAMQAVGEMQPVGEMQQFGAAQMAGQAQKTEKLTTVRRELAWYAPTKAPFKLCGFPFWETDGIYRRFPLNPPEPLPEGVEKLAWCTSGGQIRFHAELSKLYIKVKLDRSAHFGYNLIPLAGSGFDVYASDGDGVYTMAGVTRFDPAEDCYEVPLLQLSCKKKLDLIIDFPINIGVESLLIGIDYDSVPQSPPVFADERRILVHGGSIMHGFCASRPGMTLTNILSRRLNREVINLGTNGRARCERETALSVRMVPNVEWFILSPEGNNPTVEWLREHMTEFIRLYRETNPDVKIAVMSYMRESRERFDDVARQVRLAKKQCQKEIVEYFRAQGDDKIFFWDGEEFTSEAEDIYFEDFRGGDECTTDTQHKSDLGFWLMANGVCRRLADEKKPIVV